MDKKLEYLVKAVRKRLGGADDALPELWIYRKRSRTEKRLRNRIAQVSAMQALSITPEQI